MSKLDIRYLAGLIDADGSFCITLNMRGTNLFIPSWVVNFRSIHEFIVHHVSEAFGVGSIYYSRRIKENRPGIWSWQTTNQRDHLKVARRLYPYLHIKKEACVLFIETLEEWMEYGSGPRGYRKLGRLTRPRWLAEKILDAALTMNECTQTRTAIKNKEQRIDEIKGRIISFYGKAV